MVNYFDVQTTLKNPELLEDDSKDYKAYYLGKTETSDGYSLGFFKYDMKSSIDKRKVGLRKLVKSYLKYEVDAALVVFNDNNHWQLSFICDIKGEETAPKRYTYVFGEKENYYNTPVARFIKLQSEGISFKSIKEAQSVEKSNNDEEISIQLGKIYGFSPTEIDYIARKVDELNEEAKG